MIALPWLGPMAPLAADLILLLGIGAVLVADLILPPGDKRLLAWGTLGVLVAALVGTVVLDLSGEAWGGAYVGGALPVFFKQLFLVAGMLTVLGSQKYVAERFTRRQAEYYLLILFSVVGMTLLAGARDLILLVVAFELMGIPLYVLAGFARRDPLAVEGAFKLYLTGALSSVAILYGLSFLFGLSGSTRIAEVATWVVAHPSPGVVMASAIALGGMGFKLGVFPFHMWVPDTYQGSSTPFVAFLAVAPKAAGIAALVQLLYSTDAALLGAVYEVILVLVVATLVLGNLLAINQSNIKRLLGYSGVAHMGFLLMSLAVGTALGLQMVLFYLSAYLFTNIGAFLVVHAVREQGGDDSVASFDGLVARNGWLAMAMLAFLLSLAGIPFVVGFWAKLDVFVAVWSGGLYWLVVLGAVLSVLALFYYLRVARAMFMNPPASDAPVRTDWATGLGIAVCLAFVVAMGVYPRPFIEAAGEAAVSFVSDGAQVTRR